MASSLYDLAARAIREAAMKEFRRSHFGRLVNDLNSAARGGRVSASEVKRFSKRLGSLTSRDVTGEILNSMGLREVQRYARGSWGRGLTEMFKDAMRPFTGLVKSMASPRVFGRAVDIRREISAAAEFLRAFGHVVVPRPGRDLDRADQEKVADALRKMGWEVREPGGKPVGAETLPGPTLPEPRTIGAPISTPEVPPTSGAESPVKSPRVPKTKPRRTVDVDYGGPKLKNRVRRDDPLVSGEMISVVSSNVHSIGFRLEDKAHDLMSSKGTLLIRFLADHKGGKKSGPGPLYEYYDVPAAVFQEFRKAASKGGFVWDSIRVRGTVSGHKYSYSLADVTNGYVPRQAGLKRGADGEYYLTRRFRTASGEVLTSRLPEQKVRSSGPNRQGTERIERLHFLPDRGRPNRGTPDRGRS